MSQVTEADLEWAKQIARDQGWLQEGCDHDWEQAVMDEATYGHVSGCPLCGAVRYYRESS